MSKVPLEQLPLDLSSDILLNNMFVWHAVRMNARRAVTKVRARIEYASLEPDVPRVYQFKPVRRKEDGYQLRLYRESSETFFRGVMTRLVEAVVSAPEEVKAQRYTLVPSGVLQIAGADALKMGIQPLIPDGHDQLRGVTYSFQKDVPAVRQDSYARADTIAAPVFASELTALHANLIDGDICSCSLMVRYDHYESSADLPDEKLAMMRAQS